MPNTIHHKPEVVIVGGSGYAGCELIRLLKNHSLVTLSWVTSERYAGKEIAQVFPHLRDVDLCFQSLDSNSLIEKGDFFFLALPHKTSQDFVALIAEAGKRVIDFSADFRLKRARIYEKWYETKHKYQELLKKAVYGLPELYRKKIKNANIVANPGCYPTSAILGLAPIMGARIIDEASIIIDAKSGVSGAGRSPSLPYMFSEANESVKAYAVTKHRHTPEIEQELSALCKKKIKLLFTPHLIPMDRGILATMYVSLKKKLSLSKIQQLYEGFYEDEPFVRILKGDRLPMTKFVKGTNYCDIALFHDKGTNRLVIISVIDNLLKGASSQAVQNMNIIYGFNENEGLQFSNAYP